MRIFSTLLIVTIASFSFASSSFAGTTICRGGNAVLYAREIKDSVEEKLTSAGVAYTRVKVVVKAIDRRSTKKEQNLDFNSQVQVTTNPLAVTFSGDLPTPAVCELPATLTITVFNAGETIAQSESEVVIKGSNLVARP